MNQSSKLFILKFEVHFQFSSRKRSQHVLQVLVASETSKCILSNRRNMEYPLKVILPRLYPEKSLSLFQINHSNARHSVHSHYLQPLPIPAKPSKPIAIEPTPPVAPSLLLVTLPCSLTPLTTLSSDVSITTPPTIISPKQACSVSKLNIRSNSQTFSNSRSKASTNTWIRSRRARGLSVEVDIIMKYKVA